MIELNLIPFYGALQILVTHADGRRVPGRDHRRHQRGRERLRVLDRPDYTRHQSLCVRVCKRVARAHALLVVLPADSAACQVHARRYTRSARLWRVGIGGWEDTRDGYELE